MRHIQHLAILSLFASACLGLAGCEEASLKTAGSSAPLPLLDGSAGGRAEITMSARSPGGLGGLGVLGVSLDLGETIVMSDREPSDALRFEIPTRVQLLGGGERFEAEAIPPATYFAAALEPRPDETIALELTLGLLGLTHTVRVDGLPPVELRCEEISVYLHDAASLEIELELNLQNILSLVLGILPAIPLSLITIDPSAEPTLHAQLASLFEGQWQTRCSIRE